MAFSLSKKVSRDTYTSSLVHVGSQFGCTDQINAPDSIQEEELILPSADDFSTERGVSESIRNQEFKAFDRHAHQKHGNPWNNVAAVKSTKIKLSQTTANPKSTENSSRRAQKGTS